jgi:hypothetical protein
VRIARSPAGTPGGRAPALGTGREDDAVRVLYLIGAALPLAVLLGYYGWEPGRRSGLDVSDGDAMRATAWLGALWPFVLVAVAVFAFPFAVSWTIGRFSDA